MLFAHAYHSLIQSNALHALLSLERQCSRAVASLIDERDQQLDKMERQQQAQMEAAISQAGSRYSDEAISRMAQMQWEEKQLLEAKYASELEHMKAGQRREYRAFVLSVHERAETTEQVGWSPNGVAIDPFPDLKLLQLSGSERVHAAGQRVR